MKEKLTDKFKTLQREYSWLKLPQFLTPETLKNKHVTPKKSHTPFRLNFLFFIVFALFVTLLAQLAYLQIANGDFFRTKIELDEKTVVKGNAPRGQIFDEKGNVLVGNQSKSAILYTKQEAMSTSKMLETARKITELLDIPAEELTDRDKKDYWLADQEHLKLAQKRLKKEDLSDAKGEPLPNSVIYQNTVAKVKDSEIDFSEEELKTATIYKKISGVLAMMPVYIKNKDVTTEELAIAAEHSADIPGLSTGMDWSREYPAEDSMKTILGTVSTDKSGVPVEQSEKYLGNGYSRNDRVGLSYLEKYYEPVLRGTKPSTEITYEDKKEKTNPHQKVYEGEKGKNLVLTIDVEFQKQIEKILESGFSILESNGRTKYSEGIYAVVMENKTGAVKAMAGIERDLETGKKKKDALGTINKAFTPGSIVKPAMIMGGYRNNIISGNAVYLDEPIQLDGDNVKQSVFTGYEGPQKLNVVDALRKSSNVYMMKIVFDMMGETYEPNMVLGDHTNVFNTVRQNFQDFGLGAPTGIDIAGESFGLSPKDFYHPDGSMVQGRMGNLLDLSYGNFDTYTPMQLAQYVSTIANDGVKLAPHIVSGIYGNGPDGTISGLEEKIQPKVMATIGDKKDYKYIKQGMYEVVNTYDGTGNDMGPTKYEVSGKTGTAEVPRDNPKDPYNPIELYNSTMIAYTPSKDPEVSVAVVIPHITDESDKLNTALTTQIINAYTEFYDK